MLTRLAIRLYAYASVAALSAIAAAPASAQFKPQPLNEPAPGEQYHIEASARLWWPTADISVSSAQFDIVGTTIDLKRDLGLTDQRFPEISLVLSPARSHKFRFQYVPIQYDQTATLTRQIIFNGQRYNIGVPTASTLDWKAYRFGYEYDFLVRNNWFAGFILEAKYTDVQVNLSTTLPAPSFNIVEFAHARAPIPAIGGIGRYYVVPNISITGEVTAFKLPTIQNKYSGHYVDVDVYGTVNFTRNVGAQLGFRAMDAGYLVKTDTGNMTLKGLYLGVVARY
jgi:hypothetical protein